MPKIDFEKMSLKRKIAFTVVAALYALAILGNARFGIVEVICVTLAFIAITAIVLIWVK